MEQTSEYTKVPYTLGNSRFLIERKFTGEKALSDLINELVKKYTDKIS